MENAMKTLTIAGLSLATTPLAADHGHGHGLVNSVIEQSFNVIGLGFCAIMITILAIAAAQRGSRRTGQEK